MYQMFDCSSDLVSWMTEKYHGEQSTIHRGLCPQFASVFRLQSFSAQLTVHPIVCLSTYFLLLTSHCSYSSKSGCKTIIMMDFFGHNLGIKCYILVWREVHTFLWLETDPVKLRPGKLQPPVEARKSQKKQFMSDFELTRWTRFTLFGDSRRSDPGNGLFPLLPPDIKEYREICP